MKNSKFIHQAMAQLEGGDIEQAVAIAASLLINMPENPDAHYILAHANSLQGNLELAYSHINHAIIK